jgi:Ca2+-binding RTX toxin-like protein
MVRTTEIKSLGCVAVLVAAACSGPPLIEDPEPGDSSGGNGSAQPAGGGPNGSAGDDGAGGAGPLDPGDDFPGVDVEEPPQEAPSACNGGFDDEAGELDLTLDDDVPSITVGVQDGALVINGMSCSDAAGDALAVSAIAKLSVSGDGTDNTVILDLASGDWSEWLAAPEVFSLALGSGRNQLLIRGTDSADHFAHGMLEDVLLLDLLGDGAVQLTAEAVSELGFSLGGGADTVLNLTLASLGDEDMPVELTALGLPMFAFGGAGDDRLLGGFDDDVFDGGPGDDVLDGLEGNDRFNTGEAADGADLLNGGAGFDEASYELRVDDLYIQLCVSEALVGCDEGACSCQAESGEDGEEDTLVNVESVTGGVGDDTLLGSESDDSLFGNNGDDELKGGAGSDVLLGQLGTDVLEGGMDEDICDSQSSEQALDCEI